MLLNEVGFTARNLDGGYLTWAHSPAARSHQPPTRTSAMSQ